MSSALATFSKPLMASTGPRPRGRGMKMSKTEYGELVKCFNGAAPARARNAAQPTPPSTVRLSFNGAAPARARNGGLARFGRRLRQASTGPRPRGRGMMVGAIKDFVCNLWLQRGRARAGAEWPTAVEMPPGERSASTGPRPRGRGMDCHRESRLQPMLCFNGAAPARARNGSHCRPKTNPGRGFNGAAPARARNGGAAGVCRAGVGGASTGPRPRGRGMNNGTYTHTCTAGLQRGRARAGAEWPKKSGKLSARVRLLQRGRARAGAE